MLRSGKSRINNAISAFTEAENDLAKAIEIKKEEMIAHDKKTNKAQETFIKKMCKLASVDAEHKEDLTRAEKILGNFKKLLGE